MRTNHYVILGMMLAAVGLQLSGIEHWAEASSPKFVSGILLAVASTVSAMFSEKPRPRV